MLYQCFASFKQSSLDFFKLVDSRLMLMLLYDSLNLMLSGVHQSHLGCWVISQKKWSWEVWTMLRARCASALSYWKTNLLFAMCLIAINILLRWQNTLLMVSIDMQFMTDEENLQSWHGAQAAWHHDRYGDR